MPLDPRRSIVAAEALSIGREAVLRSRATGISRRTIQQGYNGIKELLETLAHEQVLCVEQGADARKRLSRIRIYATISNV